MILILMYHRAADRGLGNPPQVLRSHFRWLRDHYPVVLPGEALVPGRLNVCLTFDDALADVYAFVFPLLKEFSLRAVLSVPTGFVVPETSLGLQERLGFSAEEAMQARTFQIKAPFCTWAELGEMTDSGLVTVASHSHQHVDLTKPSADFAFEVLHSKQVLERRLGAPVSTFVYPFGRVNARAHGEVRKHYAYALRIGGALNSAWQPLRQPLSRVGADNVGDIRQVLRWDRLLACKVKWLANSWRAAWGKWQRNE